MLSAGVDSKDLAKRGESLIRQSSNRYLTTVRIAFRAKQRRFDDFDGLLEESSVKPVQRAIVELSGLVADLRLPLAALGMGRQIVLRVPGSRQRAYPMHVPFHTDQLA